MKYPEIADRFYKILSKKEMSPAELARQAGVNESSISQYMNGNHKPSNINAAKIAKVVDVNPLWLMGYDVSMTEKMSYIIEENKNDTEAAKDALKYSTLLMNAGYLLRLSESFDDVFSLSPSDSRQFNGISVNLDINDVKEYNKLLESVIGEATQKFFFEKMQKTIKEMSEGSNA